MSLPEGATGPNITPDPRPNVTIIPCYDQPKPEGTKSAKNKARSKGIAAFSLYIKSRIDIPFQVDVKVASNEIPLSQRTQEIDRIRQEQWEILTQEEKDYWARVAQVVNKNMQSLSSKEDAVASEIQQVQLEVDELYGIKSLCFLFIPPEGPMAPRVLIFDCGSYSKGRQGFFEWLRETEGEAHVSAFLDSLEEYANHLFSKEPDMAIRGNGIGIIPDPKGLRKSALQELYCKGIYDRWVACGHRDKRMPWSRVIAHPELFVRPNGLPDGLKIKTASNQGKKDLIKIVQFFYDHQEGRISWEDGLVFKPASIGSE